MSEGMSGGDVTPRRPAAFLDRMRDAIDLNTIWAGLIKAPFMALIIGIIVFAILSVVRRRRIADGNR